MAGIYDVKLLTDTQYTIVSGFLSLGFAAMRATTIYLYLSQVRVLPKYRQAIVISGTVTLIALYRFWRIYDSFKATYGGTEVFNEAYRYVDWLLTVPLLLLETTAVFALPAVERKSLVSKLIPASAAMIILGYPTNITSLPKEYLKLSAMSVLLNNLLSERCIPNFVLPGLVEICEVIQGDH